MTHKAPGDWDPAQLPGGPDPSIAGDTFPVHGWYVPQIHTAAGSGWSSVFAVNTSSGSAGAYDMNI